MAKLVYTWVKFKIWLFPLFSCRAITIMQKYWGFSLSYVAGFLSEVMKIRKSVYFLNLMIMKLRANTSTPLVVT